MPSIGAAGGSSAIPRLGTAGWSHRGWRSNRRVGHIREQGRHPLVSVSNAKGGIATDDTRIPTFDNAVCTMQADNGNALDQLVKGLRLFTRRKGALGRPIPPANSPKQHWSGWLVGDLHRPWSSGQLRVAAETLSPDARRNSSHPGAWRIVSRIQGCRSSESRPFPSPLRGRIHGPAYRARRTRTALPNRWHS